MRLIIDFRSQYGGMIQEVVRTLESKVRLILDTTVTAREVSTGGEDVIIPEAAIETFMECLLSHIRELLDSPMVIDSNNVASGDILAEAMVRSYTTLQQEVDQALQMTVLERYTNLDGDYRTATPIELKDILSGTAWQEIHEAIKFAGLRHGEIYRGVVEEFINKVCRQP